jgi:hypothetical protein
VSARQQPRRVEQGEQQARQQLPDAALEQELHWRRTRSALRWQRAERTQPV